jgi:hypothetical protein
MNNTDSFYATLILGQNTVRVFETGSNETQRFLSILLNSKKIGEISVLKYYIPSFGFDGEQTLRIWCGSKLFSIDFATEHLQQFEESDEIIAVYSDTQKLLIVRETSIVVRETLSYKLIAQYDLAEVITECRLDNKRLYITDLDNGKYFIDLGNEDQSILQMVDIAA